MRDAIQDSLRVTMIALYHVPSRKYITQAICRTIPERRYGPRPFEYVLSNHPKVYVNYPTNALNSITKNGVAGTDGKIIAVKEEDIKRKTKDVFLTWI